MLGLLLANSLNLQSYLLSLESVHVLFSEFSALFYHSKNNTGPQVKIIRASGSDSHGAPPMAYGSSQAHFIKLNPVDLISERPRE